MSATLARYEQQATILDREALTRERPSKWDDMAELAQMAYADRPLKQQMNDMWINGEPMNVAGGLAGLEANPPGADAATVTIGTATELAMVAPATYCPIPALQVGPKAYYLKIYGQTTSAATPGTQTFNPRIGTTAAGISMGISSALTPTASETAVLFKLQGDVVLRDPGKATSSATGFFEYAQTTGTTGNNTLTTPLGFGGTSAGSIDTTVAQGLWMGLLAVTSTTNTVIPRLVIWASWN